MITGAIATIAGIVMAASFFLSIGAPESTQEITVATIFIAPAIALVLCPIAMIIEDIFDI